MNTKTKQGGLGIVSILTMVFIVLKLSGVIKWHWIWVLSPIWISALTAAARRAFWQTRRVSTSCACPPEPILSSRSG